MVLTEIKYFLFFEYFFKINAVQNLDHMHCEYLFVLFIFMQISFLANVGVVSQQVLFKEILERRCYILHLDLLQNLLVRTAHLLHDLKDLKLNLYVIQINYSLELLDFIIECLKNRVLVHFFNIRMVIIILFLFYLIQKVKVSAPEFFDQEKAGGEGINVCLWQ